MKVVVAHNHYGEFAIGGEANVFRQEVDLLRRFGHEVETLEHTNAEILKLPTLRKLTFPLRTGFSKEVYAEATALFRRFRPDVVHVHNYKYALTPAIFQAAQDYGAPSVLTLHNFRLICPGGQLRRGSVLCEECLTRNPIRELWRKDCASKTSARFLQYLFYCQTRPRVLRDVDGFIALSQFAKEKFALGGLPREKIFVKPNFIFDPRKDPMFQGSNANGAEGSAAKKSAIFIGRLASEKGVRFLIDAWRDLDIPLIVVGDGPEAESLRKDAPSSVSFLGAKTREETLALLENAMFLAFPSVWYEAAPLALTLMEAAALGVPSIATNIGGREDVIGGARAGLLFAPNDRAAFVEAVKKLQNEPGLAQELGRNARKTYERDFTPEANYAILEGIYNATRENFERKRKAS